MKPDVRMGKLRIIKKCEDGIRTVRRECIAREAKEEHERRCSARGLRDCLLIAWEVLL